MQKTGPVISVADLWRSRDQRAWSQALDRYWDFVLPENIGLEREMEALKLEDIQRLDPQGWYDFLLEKYFRWKYTAKKRYASTSKWLKLYAQTGTLGELYGIKERLVSFDPTDTGRALSLGCEIKGLGTAGASGLLALMYPESFATVDQFAVKALREVKGLPEAVVIAAMKPEALSITNGVVLIGVMRRKATENNRLFRGSAWTPRKIDKILWTYGR